MDVLAAARAARTRLGDFVRHTPLEVSIPLTERLGREVYLKMENLQVTGSFKARGAVNRLLCLTDSERRRGITAASSGNHGAGVAYGLSRLGIEGTIYVPKNADPGKVAAIRGYGARMEIAGETCEEAEAAAREQADRKGLVFVSPYNDGEVVAGQGTLALEIGEDLAQAPDVAFVSVGGGGLIGGVGGVLKGIWPGIRAIGCSPQGDAAMAASLRAGKIVSVNARPTLSDGTAGGVEPGSLTFGLCQKVVDDFILVPEEGIRESLLWMLATHRTLVEGAAAVAVAAAVQSVQSGMAWRRAVVVLCGGNLSLDRLKTLL